MWATTVQLYPGRDTFEFDQGHVTKNQPITVLILLSESLAWLFLLFHMEVCIVKNWLWSWKSTQTDPKPCWPFPLARWVHVTLTVVREKKIQTALGTNQIAGFVLPCLFGKLSALFYFHVLSKWDRFVTNKVFTVCEVDDPQCIWYRNQMSL